MISFRGYHSAVAFVKMPIRTKRFDITIAVSYQGEAQRVGAAVGGTEVAWAFHHLPLERQQQHSRSRPPSPPADPSQSDDGDRRRLVVPTTAVQV